MMKKYSFLLIPVLAALLSGLLFFTSLDNKIFDLFLRTLPSLREDKSVLILTVDDVAIENVGIFPWTRDIYADALIFLREMGAHTVAFDLSYLDDSPVIINPDYIRNELPMYVDNGFRRLNDAVDRIMDAYESGGLGPRDAPEARQYLRGENGTVKNELEVSIDYVTRDVDAYFAQAIGFFGRTFLTLTMVSPEDILAEEKSFDMSGYDVPWLEEHIALKNITVAGDALIPDRPGMMPAILKLMSRSAGAGFVNAGVDRDGYRRRLNLVMKHNGQYYAHLALRALMESLGTPLVEISSSRIVLKNASLRGAAPRDIRIPLADDGTVLLKWPRKDFADYNIMSFWRLSQYNGIEKTFANNLALMADSGFFGYWEEAENPYDKYTNARYIEAELYKGEDPGGGITFDTYLEFRRDYIESAGRFLRGPYEDSILGDLGDDEETQIFVKEVFRTAREQYAGMMALRKEVARAVKDSICIVGMTATSGTDLELITFQERYPNVGTYAVIMHQILGEEFLDDAPPLVSFIIALALALALALIIKRLDTSKSILVGFSAMIFTAAVFCLFFVVSKRYLGLAAPFMSVALTFLSLTGLNFFSTIREKSFLRSAFSRYLSPAVISEIINDPSKLNLGGEKREMTAIFTDVQSFSTISSKLQDKHGDEGPQVLVNLLNLYLTEMSNIVLGNGGTIDKFEGDAIIAFFGAPLHVPNHASLACRTAIQMKRREAELRAEIMNPAGPYHESFNELISGGRLPQDRPLYTRIGVNTGDMVVGNMGTPNKMDYTIMGNAVNLTARLEGVNKQYYTRGILISEYTRSHLGDEFVIRPLSRVTVVGIPTPLRLYELLALRNEAPQELCDMAEVWESALAAYEGKDFAGALKNFQSILERDEKDGVAGLYRLRCENYIKNPPPVHWDGVDNLTEK
jgi:adenylate cyclase